MDQVDPGRSQKRTPSPAEPAPKAKRGRKKGANEPPPNGEDDYGANPGEVTQKIDELNETYALVLVNNTVAVLHQIISSEGEPTFALMTPKAFHQWLANSLVMIDGKAVPISYLWFRSRQRRQYEGLVFAPGRTLPRYYNLWKDFVVKPKPGDCSKFLAHLKDNICKGDKELYRWVIAWFADIFQHPQKKTGTSLVLRGKPGVGKTKVGEVFGRLLRPHYLLVADPRYITDRFNAHMVSLLLLHADEAFWAGDKRAEGKLKDLVTGDRHPIEFKHIDVILIRNYVRLLVTGNQDWLVPAAMEERRFAVLDVGEEHREDYEYFAAIDRERDNGGAEALLHHLLNLDISGVNLRKIPQTAALLDQKMASLGSEQAWWLDILTKGILPAGCDLPNETPATAAYESYIEARPGRRREPPVHRDQARSYPQEVRARQPGHGRPSSARRPLHETG